MARTKMLASGRPDFLGSGPALEKQRGPRDPMLDCIKRLCLGRQPVGQVVRSLPDSSLECTQDEYMVELRNPAHALLIVTYRRENVPLLLDMKQAYLDRFLPSHARMLHSRELPNGAVKVGSEAYQVGRLSLLRFKVYHVTYELFDTHQEALLPVIVLLSGSK